MDDWGKVVTRYPYGNVGMDHLLSREKQNKKQQSNAFYSVLRDYEFLKQKALYFFKYREGL